jgi:hypothetical protein
MERTFSILEEIIYGENIWYTHNRSYNYAVDYKIIAYNLMVISSILSGERHGRLRKSSVAEVWDTLDILNLLKYAFILLDYRVPIIFFRH